MLKDETSISTRIAFLIHISIHFFKELIKMTCLKITIPVQWWKTATTGTIYFNNKLYWPPTRSLFCAHLNEKKHNQKETYSKVDNNLIKLININL